MSGSFTKGLMIGMTMGSSGTSSCPLVLESSLSYSENGVTITKDTVSEVWTWTKDGSGNIIGMTSNKGRTVSIN